MGVKNLVTQGTGTYFLPALVSHAMPPCRLLSMGQQLKASEEAKELRPRGEIAKILKPRRDDRPPNPIHQ